MLKGRCGKLLFICCLLVVYYDKTNAKPRFGTHATTRRDAGTAHARRWRRRRPNREMHASVCVCVSLTKPQLSARPVKVFGDKQTQTQTQ